MLFILKIEVSFQLHHYLFQVFIGVAAFFVVSIGGMIIGIFWAFLTAFLTKYTDHVRGIELLQ